MSNLKKGAGVLFQWKRLVELRTTMKLSWMLLLLMKALWFGETSLFICGASRNASTLVIILAKEWMRLIGRKSQMESAPSFLGSRMMFAEFNRGRLVVLSKWKAFAAFRTSALTMSQHCLKRHWWTHQAQAPYLRAYVVWRLWVLLLWKACLGHSDHVFVTGGFPS